MHTKWTSNGMSKESKGDVFSIGLRENATSVYAYFQ